MSLETAGLSGMGLSETNREQINHVIAYEILTACEKVGLDDDFAMQGQIVLLAESLNRADTAGVTADTMQWHLEQQLATGDGDDERRKTHNTLVAFAMALSLDRDIPEIAASEHRGLIIAVHEASRYRGDEVHLAVSDIVPRRLEAVHLEIPEGLRAIELGELELTKSDNELERALGKSREEFETQLRSAFDDDHFAVKSTLQKLPGTIRELSSEADANYRLLPLGSEPGVIYYAGDKKGALIHDLVLLRYYYLRRVMDGGRPDELREALTEPRSTTLNSQRMFATPRYSRYASPAGKQLARTLHDYDLIRFRQAQPGGIKHLAGDLRTKSLFTNEGQDEALNILTSR
jgi:hypothetical protein